MFLLICELSPPASIIIASLTSTAIIPDILSYPAITLSLLPAICCLTIISLLIDAIISESLII